MVKKFVNKRNELYETKRNALLSGNWRPKGTVKRLNRNEFRKHLHKNMSLKKAKELGKSIAQLTPKELVALNAELNAQLNREAEHYEVFEKAEEKRSKKGKKGNNVVMKERIEYGEEFATEEDVKKQQNYIKKHKHLMNDKERKKYEKEQHNMSMAEIEKLASKLRVRSNQMNGNNSYLVSESADATPYLRPPSNAPSAKRKTLHSYTSNNQPSYRWSKSKKKLVSTANYNRYAKKQKTITMKNVEKALASTHSESAASAFAHNNNNNNTDNNYANNSNNNTKKNNFRMRNWRK
jgi:hypothetical protein